MDRVLRKVLGAASVAFFAISLVSFPGSALADPAGGPGKRPPRRRATVEGDKDSNYDPELTREQAVEKCEREYGNDSRMGTMFDQCMKRVDRQFPEDEGW